MINITNLSYSFPEKDLYNDVSFTIEDGQHCAFIGTNGSGKSTLIDIIMDPEKYMYDGTVEKDPNCTIGYVSQFSQVDKSRNITVFEYISEEFIRLQNEIDSLCTEMGTSDDLDTLLVKYQEALDAYEAIGGDGYEGIIDKQLNLTNLMEYKNAIISDLSGGEFKLIQIIRGMINSPDLLIMDEPDVFLDFENLNSLKNLINTYKGTILVITHNRYLLNNCFNKIIHLENMQIQEFDGTYIDYNFSLLETKVELQELAAADTAEIERNDILIDRLRELATENAEQFRGKTLRARVKIQERLEARRIKAPFIAITEPKINFATDNTLEENATALKVTNYSVSFDELLLENVNFEIKATDKVAIVGSNGTGKSTLLQEIVDNNNSSIEINEQVEIAYLSQVQGKTLNESNSIHEEFLEAGFKNYDEIKEYLAGFNFKEELINQDIYTFSGGEKNMLQLAKISASNANILILDEPTSHLDTYSQIALEKAIKNYNGAVLMVSHDFYSIVNCADYVLIVEDKSIRRMSIKNFKKMIYANHFDKDYLEVEHNKKMLETRIELALKNNDFEEAKELCEALSKQVKLLQS